MKRLFCLDLEGTIISNAISQIPRPGIFSFLEFLGANGSVVLFTSVSPRRSSDIQRLLVAEGHAPDWFAGLDVLNPEATVKRRAVAEAYAPGLDQYLLLDDQAGVVDPSERNWWVPVAEFEPPYSTDEDALAMVQADLLTRLSQ